DEKSFGEVRKSLHRVAEKLIHTPTVKVKELAVTESEVDYAQALMQLFDLPSTRSPMRSLSPRRRSRRPPAPTTSKPMGSDRSPTTPSTSSNPSSSADAPCAWAPAGPSAPGPSPRRSPTRPRLGPVGGARSSRAPPGETTTCPGWPDTAAPAPSYP